MRTPSEVLDVIPLLDAPARAACAARVAAHLRPTGAAYPADYRDNDRAVFDDEALAAAWFAALRPSLPEALVHGGETWTLDSLNPRFRACRYADGQSFCVHRDGPWVPDAHRRTLLTVMAYLSDPADFTGGATRFWTTRDRGALLADLRPGPGDALVFDHAAWHEGCPVTAGVKSVLRTDVVYRRAAPSADRGYLWAVVLHDGAPAVAGRDGEVHWRERRFLGAHSSILCLASTPGALVGGDREGRLHRWPTDGAAPTAWDAHAGAVLALAAGPAGLHSAGADGRLRTWDPAGRLLHDRATGGWPWGLALDDAGGVHVATGDVRAVTFHAGALWRGLADGSLVGPAGRRPAHAGPVRCLLSTPAGLVSGGEDGAVLLHDPHRAYPPTVLATHPDFVTSVATHGARLWSVGYAGRVVDTALPVIRHRSGQAPLTPPTPGVASDSRRRPGPKTYDRP
jgi:predicted 2-oxoglutarate/Fe(II)-dependent dioxygenase YbiX